MQAQTRRRYRGLWFFLVISISLATLWSGNSETKYPLGAMIGHRWAHFLLYLATGCIAFLAWRLWTALAVSAGIAIVSVALQIAKASLAHSPVDGRALIVNVFGVVAGVLLALNILTFRANSTRHQVAKTEGQVPSGPE
ncbi:MAG: hypothetical protein KGN79_01500 [Acidobacteriota bacterium]|nr:hypothetical protein [Acidobacteriota bacterium]